jgi:Flp pilus assembly protein TadG
MIFSLRRRARSKRGASLVELALVLPVLLLLVGGVADFGRAFYTYIALTNASREGARAASNYPQTQYEAYVKQAAIDEASSGGVTITAANVTISRPAGVVSGQPIRVTVQGQITTIVGRIIGYNSFPMRSTTEMTILSEP